MVIKKLSAIAIALVLSVAGCNPLQGTKVLAAKPGIEVRGDMIYRNGEAFAEIRYLSLPPSGDGYYRGFAIYYYPSMKEVWICPKGGWQIRGGSKLHYTVREIEEAAANPQKTVLREGKLLQKEEAIAAWCFDIKISEDGRSVSYKTYSSFRMFSEPLSRRSHQYLVDYDTEGAQETGKGGP
jgi:hypothetical protein